MFARKHRTATMVAAAALTLGIPAASSAAIGLPGFGLNQPASGATSVSSVVGNGVGVLGAGGPLGKNGPLAGKGCIAAGVNVNSYGPDGPLGPNGPLGPGGIKANLAGCSSGNSSSNSFMQFAFFPLFGN
jgi:hypothetical protein